MTKTYLRVTHTQDTENDTIRIYDGFGMERAYAVMPVTAATDIEDAVDALFSGYEQVRTMQEIGNLPPLGVEDVSNIVGAIEEFIKQMEGLEHE